MEPKQYTLNEIILICESFVNRQGGEFYIQDLPFFLLEICKKLQDHEDRFKSQDRQCFEHGIERCSECD